MVWIRKNFSRLRLSTSHPFVLCRVCAHARQTAPPPSESGDLGVKLARRGLRGWDEIGCHNLFPSLVSDEQAMRGIFTEYWFKTECSEPINAPNLFYHKIMK
ncbi:hypothetical protein CEXT_600151 [Caerostris extrusa]|uniref:Uncharacterized protein n=1 Tax=Caerostris extrusa TaxID=172846 RepID=A0AAV4Q7K0_CAEEX|nr:hypothetical protein CEXT_600151 [Caerostris extrusa]